MILVVEYWELTRIPHPGTLLGEIAEVSYWVSRG